MADFDALETELNAKGTRIVYMVKHTENVVVFYYNDIQDTKQAMDALVQSYLTNYTVTSTLENGEYKGDATI